MFVIKKGEMDPRYATENSSMNLRQTLSTLQKSTHQFVREHNELSSHVQYLKYRNFVEDRNSYRSGDGKWFSRFYSSEWIASAF